MDQSARRHSLGLMARAPEGRLAALARQAGLDLPTIWLRAPQIGAVMVQGRIGSTGDAFNLGEMSVTRASVSAGGATGHGYVQGRSKEAAGFAALIDALMQGREAARLRAAVLEPLATEEAERRRIRAEKAAATKVEFFTLVRGED